MAEAFTAALDAYTFGSVKTGKVKAKRALPTPWYLKDPDAPASKGLTGQKLHDAVDRMMKRLN